MPIFASVGLGTVLEKSAVGLGTVLVVGLDQVPQFGQTTGRRRVMMLYVHYCTFCSCFNEKLAESKETHAHKNIYNTYLTHESMSPPTIGLMMMSMNCLSVKMSPMP